MSRDTRQRFERWCQSAPPRTAKLAALVLDQLVPSLEREGFEWARNVAEFGDMADGRPDTIPLLRRVGPEWPALVIAFSQRKAPWFQMHFGVLPEVCRQGTATGWVPIPRSRARVFSGPCFFAIVRRERGALDTAFGARGLRSLSDLLRPGDLARGLLAPESRMQGEIDQAIECLSDVRRICHEGLPREWLTAPLGPVGEHLQLLESDHWRDAAARAS